MISMRLLILTLLTTVLLAAGCVASRSSEPRPNILLIMADDLGYEALGCNGGLSYETPQLDILAGGGIRFTHAYANPLCTPSRVQIMTGKYNFRNYVGFGLIDPGERTFAHALKAAGYATAIAGKWQLYGNSRQRDLAGRGGSTPEEMGFDEYCLWQVHDRGARYKNPLIETNGEPSRLYQNDYGPDVFLHFIQKFLRRKRDKPFFLYYPMVLTHAPFQPTPDSPEYQGFDSRQPLNDPVFFRDNVAYMDKVVGKLVQTLEELGIAENTLLLFTGDNGTDRHVTSFLGTREIRGNKGYTTEAGTHVPLIAYWPDTISGGQVNDNLIDFTDFYPTLMDAAGVEKRRARDGISFYPSLVGRDAPTRDWIFYHYDPHWGKFQPQRWVQSKDWKLYGDGRFYHIAIDPDETSPIEEGLLSGERKELKEQFQSVLSRMR